MKAPYLTVDFSLSASAWDWAQTAIQPAVDDYQINAPLDGGLVNLTADQKKQWYHGPVWREIKAFTDSLGLPPGEIQFFIYKSRPPIDDPRGNPHIDTMGTGDHDGDRFDVPVRFNILLRGETNQKMSWWNRDRTDPAVEVFLFKRKDGSLGRRLQARGAKSLAYPTGSKTEQYSHLGEPDWTCDNLAQLNRRASFVRTDILHALDWTAYSPRVVLSIRFREPWSTIELQRDRY